jgi:hypothetical protein
MKKSILFMIICLGSSILFAQQKPTVIPVANADKKIVPIVPTKLLKKQLESAYKRKKYKLVLPIADTLLKRNPKDEKVFMTKLGSQIMLKMDKPLIAHLKKWYKNKDSAATIIAVIPAQFDFYSQKRNAAIYYSSAIAWAPKNGIPYLYKAAQLADDGKPEEAFTNGKKGYDLLNTKYKKSFINLYATVLFACNKKPEAYKIMEDEIAGGNNSYDILKDYFTFYYKDKRFQEGIDKATEYIKMDSLGNYFGQRALLYNDMGNTEKACEDAQILKAQFDGGDYWGKLFNCPQIMADVKPNLQRTYIYEVFFNDMKYDFRVSNPKVDMDNGVSFKYKLTGEVGYDGTVSISKEAIATAHDQMNKFGKETIELNTKTSVWISKEVFNEFKTNGYSSINANDWEGTKEFQLVSEKNSDDSYYPVTIDDEVKYVKCIRVIAKNGEELWINDDVNNPIILKMKVDFSIELKQVL